MAKKRGQILPRAEVERDLREAVAIAGSCRIGARPAEDVLVTDLGSTGCCVRGTWLGLTKSEPLELTIGEVGPLAARLKWARKGSLGVAFEVPLAEDILQALYAESESANVVPLRRQR